ncbi:MAG: hypothetical protein IPL78_34755 [Chloroflexi bacterium]|nr:hypothetical protein [Chloroflexota bacterium]
MTQAQTERLPKALRRKGNYDYATEPAQSWGHQLGTWLLWGVVGLLIILFGRTLVLVPGDEEPLAAANPPTFTVTHTTTPTHTFTHTPSATPRPSQTPLAATLPVTFTPLALATVTPLPSRTPTATPDETIITANVAAAGINVHSGPHPSYPVVWQIATVAQILTVTGQSEDGLWLQVCCTDGLGGWLTAEAVVVNGDLAHVPVIPKMEPHITILPVRLNVRSGPGVIYPVLAVVEQGVEYEIVASYQDGLWWQICCINNRNGWVIGESVTVYGDTSTIPQAVNIPPTPTFTPQPIILSTATPISNEP